jgi:hypothetical protein
MAAPSPPLCTSSGPRTRTPSAPGLQAAGSRQHCLNSELSLAGRPHAHARNGNCPMPVSSTCTSRNCHLSQFTGTGYCAQLHQSPVGYVQPTSAAPQCRECRCTKLNKLHCALAASTTLHAPRHRFTRHHALIALCCIVAQHWYATDKLQHRWEKRLAQNQSRSYTRLERADNSSSTSRICQRRLLSLNAQIDN